MRVCLLMVSCIRCQSLCNCSAAYGTPIALANGGPDPIGCIQGQYNDATHNLFVEFAREEMSHVQGIQTALGELSL